MEPEYREEEIHEMTTLLPWYLNNTLDEAERREVEQHLTICEACCKELEELRQLRMTVQTAYRAQPTPSSDLFQRVRARVELYEAIQEREHATSEIRESPWWEWIRVWFRPLFAPRWVPVVVTALIIVQLVIIASLLGIHSWRRQDLVVTLPPSVEPEKAIVGKDQIGYRNVYTFQSAMQNETAFGPLVNEHSILRDQPTTFGFAPKPESATAFLIGTLYAEALAYVRSNELERAAQHVASIEGTLRTKQGLQPLSTYLHQTRILLEGKRYPREVLGHILALFQPLYETYTLFQGLEQPLLFQIGAWLANMRLATAAGDHLVLKQGESVHYFYMELQKIGAPKGVLEALEQLTHLVEQPELTDQELKQVLKLVKKIQTILG